VARELPRPLDASGPNAMNQRETMVAASQGTGRAEAEAARVPEKVASPAARAEAEAAEAIKAEAEAAEAIKAEAEAAEAIKAGAAATDRVDPTLGAVAVDLTPGGNQAGPAVRDNPAKAAAAEAIRPSYIPNLCRGSLLLPRS